MSLWKILLSRRYRRNNMNQFFETTMPEAVEIQSEHIKNFI